MPRSLRLERANGVYHIINRGNYQQDLFVDDGTHLAFENCLFEACEKCGWVLEGFCVMTNHFHLVVRTPNGNLVYGMQWLQATFANRYHRFRKIHGKLFQGRYKSLIVEEETYLGALLHYVHLNPVRAYIVGIDKLRDFRWSSLWYLYNPRKRPGILNCAKALEAAGGLKDSPVGRSKYSDYLRWLSANEPARKKMAFDRMCRGWALGSRDFKKELLDRIDEYESGDRVRIVRFDGEELMEVNELRWETCLAKGLGVLGKTGMSIGEEKKCADWKVLLAAALKARTSATNGWIARRLNMGVPSAVSRYVGIFRDSGGYDSVQFMEICTKITA